MNEIRGGRVERKDPTLTFIGGLVIGLVVGGMMGAALMGSHVLAILGN